MSIATKQQQVQFFGAINAMFETVVLPTLDTDSKRLAYSEVMIPWNVNEVLSEGRYFKYGIDENGFPIVYKSLRQHVAQSNIKPDGEHSSTLYEKIGYVDGVRIWVQPHCAYDSYALNQVVPHNGFNWKSLKDDNRFEPIDGAPVWEKL